MENSYLTISGQADAIRGFSLPSLALRNGSARIVEPSYARIAQMIGLPSSWPSAGVMPAQRVAAQQHQDRALVDIDGCDVTKFSTRWGPLSCSPPV